MSRSNKTKLSSEAQPGGGLYQAFAGLKIGGLPPGPQSEESKASGGGTKRGRVVLRRETAHRGGKCVLIVDGFDDALDQPFLEALAKRLRAACGCGGTLKARTIELQGDHTARVRQCLTAEGFRVAGIG
ncbi:MAG: translation initiation factor [Verrucomicrobiota bacterium]